MAGTGIVTIHRRRPSREAVREDELRGVPAQQLAARLRLQARELLRDHVEWPRNQAVGMREVGVPWPLGDPHVLQVEGLKAAQDVGGRVLVAARARRPVLRFGDPDL